MSAKPYTREDVEEQREFHKTRTAPNPYGCPCYEEADAWLATLDARDTKIARLLEAMKEAAQDIEHDEMCGAILMVPEKCTCSNGAIAAKLESALGGDPTDSPKEV